MTSPALISGTSQESSVVLGSFTVVGSVPRGHLKMVVKSHGMYSFSNLSEDACQPCDCLYLDEVIAKMEESNMVAV